MQISKVPLLLCACVLAAAVNVHAQDNAAQAAARAALASRLFEMDAQSPPATNTAPAAPKSAIADVPPATTAPATEPVMVPVGGDAKSQADAAQAAADARARQLADKQAAEDQAKADADAKMQGKSEAEKAAAEAKAKKIADKKYAEQQAKAEAAAKAQAKADAEKAAAVKAREDAAAKAQAKADAKAKKLADKEAQKKHDAEVAAAEKQARLNTDAAIKPPPPAAVTMPDMVAPPAPVSASKQQQLADLLSKYQADQITPDEYQKQRADILAQP